MKTNSPQDAELIVQKIPSDMGLHRIARKGTLNAPEKILEDFEFPGKVLVDEVFPDEFDLENTQRRIESNARELVHHDKPLLSIGGDHSVTYPVARVLKSRHPDLHVVWLDAHLDMKEKVSNHVSHDTVVRELLRKGFKPGEVWLVGISRIDDDEQEFIQDRDLNIYRSDEVEEFKREFNSGEQPVYLSLDIDVLENVEGTGYPDGELSLEQVKDVIDTVDPDSADLVEAAPPFDRDGKTVGNARELLSELEKALDQTGTENSG